jgi:hypothetical protein
MRAGLHNKQLELRALPKDASMAVHAAAFKVGRRLEDLQGAHRTAVEISVRDSHRARESVQSGSFPSWLRDIPTVPPRAEPSKRAK